MVNKELTILSDTLSSQFIRRQKVGLSRHATSQNKGGRAAAIGLGWRYRIATRGAVMAKGQQRSNKEKKKPKADKGKKDTAKASPFAAAAPKGGQGAPGKGKK